MTYFDAHGFVVATQTFDAVGGFTLTLPAAYLAGATAAWRCGRK